MRKTNMPSRRRRGFRRLLVAAAAVLVVNHVFMVGLLFPIQAIRQNEEREGVGRTVVICRAWAPEIAKSQVFYLTGNENVTMLSGAYLTYLGWFGGGGLPLDCTEEATVYGGWLAMKKKDQGAVLYAFGRVDDPDIARMEVRLQYTDWKEEDHTVLTWNSERGEWMEQDGRYYFLFRTYPPFDWTDYQPALKPVAVCWDEAGNEIARVKLDQRSSSSRS